MTSRTTYIQRYIDSIHENLINQGVNILPLGVNLYFEGSIVTSVTIIVDRAQYLFWVIDPSTYSLTCTVIVQDNDNVLLKRRDITITPNINITPREILRTASEHTVNFLNAGGTLDLPIILARFTR